MSSFHLESPVWLVKKLTRDIVNETSSVIEAHNTQPRPFLRTIFVRLKTNKTQPRPLLRTIFVRHKTNKIQPRPLLRTILERHKTDNYTQ